MTIRVLSGELVDQIAAGEVIERPASVVKELLENSLDAGASRIEIDIERGGLGLIRVRDDGCGMTAEELPLALHAPRHQQDRQRSRTWSRSPRLGFRGEALPSIGSVSRLRIVSRAARGRRGRRESAATAAPERRAAGGPPAGHHRRGARPLLQRAGAAQVRAQRGHRARPHRAPGRARGAVALRRALPPAQWQPRDPGQPGR